MKYAWKKWKLGLAVAGVTGTLGALVALGVVKDIGGWKQFLLILGVGAAKDVLLFLHSHPVESLPDTDIITKTP